jgi:hypothetical protein
MPYRITEIWAFTSIDEDDEEGIVAMHVPNHGWMPMIAADRTRLEQLRPEAVKIASITGRDMRLSRFTVRENVEVISPPPPPTRTSKGGERCTDGEALCVQRRICPDCGARLDLGPRGGLAQNFTCSGCGSRFNDTVMAVDRISDAAAGTGRPPQ